MKVSYICAVLLFALSISAEAQKIDPTQIKAMGTTSSMVLTTIGDSYPDCLYCVNRTTQAFPAIVATVRGWANNNMAVASNLFADMVAHYPWSRTNTLSTPTLIETGINDVTQMCINDSCAGNPLSSTDRSALISNMAAYTVWSGSLETQKTYGTNCTYTGAWGANTGLVGSFPAYSLINQGGGVGSTVTCSFYGTRGDILTAMSGLHEPTVFQFSAVCDGTITATSIASDPTHFSEYGNNGGQYGLADTYCRNLSLGNHTITLTITSISAPYVGGFIVLGAVGSYSGADHPLVIDLYVGRFPQSYSVYSVHTDATVEDVWTYQAALYETLKQDGYNIVAVNYTASGVPGHWLNPNDPAAYVQLPGGDGGHPNATVGHPQIAQSILDALTRWQSALGW